MVFPDPSISISSYLDFPGNILISKTPDNHYNPDFLESRCFPESRDKMKLILKDLGLPFYDPIMIIEKTKGRMAEDDFWIRIER